MKMKKRGGLIAGLAILAVAAILVVAGILAARGVFGGMGSGPSALLREEEAAGEDAIVLFAANHEFQTGETGVMELTIRCREDVTGPVTVTDDRGRELAVVENDGSGQLNAAVEISGQEPRYGQLRASAGEEISAPISFYVIPEITEEMGERLLSVCTQLGDYAEQAGFADPFGEDALESVAAWLAEDQRVRAVKRAGEGLLFETVDGLMGSYGLSRTSPNSFGFVEEETAFEAHRAGKSTGGLFISSEIPATNTKLLHLSPIPEDRVVSLCSQSFRDSEEKLAERVGGELTWLESAGAIERLAAGRFTDYGITILNTHGSQLERADGSPMLLMNMGEKTKGQIGQLVELLDYTVSQQSAASYGDQRYKSVWGLLDEPGSIRWLVDVTINEEGQAKYVLKMASGYLECALGDRVFDNTILYFIVCYAKSDDRMVQMLHRHGASAFIGCREALDAGLAVAFSEHMAETMGEPETAYAYGALEDLSEPFSTSTNQLVQTVVYPDREDYEAYQAVITQRPLRYSYLGGASRRVLVGQGDVKGTVLDADLNEEGDAQVTLYRWLDHEFQQVWTGVTGEDGSFLAQDIPYGVYGILAGKDGKSGSATAVLEDGAKTLDAGNVILDWTGAENNGGNVVRYRGNLYYWKYSGESFYPTGLFAYYSPEAETVNQLICRQEDGSEKVLLRVSGQGGIFIVGDRIYVERDGGNLLSIDLEGGDRVEHGAFEPWAADEASGTLLGSYGRGGVHLLSAKDHSIRSVAAEGQVFLGEADGYCYYYTWDDQGASSATLWQATLDGSEITALSRTSGEVKYGMGIGILQVIKVGDEVYYSYGCYGGSGGFLQNGGINRVNLQSGETQVCVAYGELGAEEFMITEDGDEIRIHYVGKEDAIGSYIGFWDDYPYTKCRMKTQAEGAQGWSDAPDDSYICRPGAFVCVGGEILRYNEELLSYQTLVPGSAGFDFLDNPTGEEDRIALVTELDIVGEDLFFTVEWSVRRRDQDMGWRPGYQRERSVLYTMKIGESQPVELYGY